MNEAEKNIAGRIKNIIKQKDPSAEVILFGSHARGQATKESDWDVLILLDRENVTRLTQAEFMDELFDLELEIREPISPFVFSKSDWESTHSVTPFYQSIKEEGIRL